MNDNINERFKFNLINDGTAYEVSLVPFTARHVANETGLNLSKVGKYILRFTTEGYIKMIGKDKGMNVYILNRHHEKVILSKSKRKQK